MSLLKRLGDSQPVDDAPSEKVAIPVFGGSGTFGTAGQVATAAPPLVSVANAPQRASFREASTQVMERVITDLDPKLDLADAVEVRRQIEEVFGRAVEAEGLELTRAERARMLGQISDEIVGLGPLEPLLRDESVTEVMVKGP